MSKGRMLNLNDLFEGLAHNELCLEVSSNIAGQDTNFDELSCKVKDPYGIIIGTFDYQRDHELHGGNVKVDNEIINPHGWYSKEYNILEFINKVITK